jgi:TolB protein
VDGSATVRSVAVVTIGLVSAMLVACGSNTSTASSQESARATASAIETPAPIGEAIAYIVSYDIHVISPDGIGDRALGVTPEIETGPAWSPDGGRIAYGVEGSRSIFLMNADGSDRRPIVSNIPGDSGAPAWSPDGEHLVFNAFLNSGGAALYTVNVDGSGLVELLRDANSFPGGPHWSPDGTRIVFASGSDQADVDLYVINVGGSEPMQLTDEPGADSAARWAPDGSKLAFFSDRDGGGIFFMNPDGSGIEQIIGNPLGARVGTVVWSPDGQRLAFIGEYSGGGNRGSPLHILNVDGSDFHPITEANATGSTFSWRAAP